MSSQVSHLPFCLGVHGHPDAGLVCVDCPFEANCAKVVSRTRLRPIIEKFEELLREASQ